MVDVDFEVVSLAPCDPLETSGQAPEFTRPLVTHAYWEDRSLGELLADGHDLTILVFTPMVGSFVPKYVFDELTNRGWDQTVDLVGVTISDPYAISRFLDDNDYDCPFVSDPANELGEAFGISHDLDGMAGIEEPRPAVFVLESDRTIAGSWVAREWPAFPPYDELEREYLRD